MKTIQLISYKVAPRISLELIASFFKLPTPSAWEDYLELGNAQLGQIFKCRTLSKCAFIFDYGCVTLINLNTDEIKIFMEYFQLVAGTIKNNMFTTFCERHIIKIHPNTTVSLWDNNNMQTFSFSKNIIPIIASVLAKSSALIKIEADIDVLLDKAEGIINNLHIGRFTKGTRRYASITAQILRFEYESANSIKIFDRPRYTEDDMLLRKIYDSLAKHYELFERFDILNRKTNELRNITNSYSTLSYSHQERRLFFFEAYLLALFPLSYVIPNLFDNFNISHILQLLFR